ncbi:MAG: xanthine dehydrogenase accessory protein XdhC [Desulfohalobiaceae bacterium]|nr:xanthine dehydrogenase accessory protein XdhC [Desulfohalobiaceae bacterium]
MKTAPIEEAILERLESGEALVLATILTQAGSTPRTAGTKMIIHRDGSILGTIGGGLVEAETIKAAAQVFADKEPQTLDFDLSSQGLTQSMDLICGGKTRVCVEMIHPDQATIQDYRRQAQTIKAARTRLYLFGAGHVARQTAVLAALVDFRVIVLDDRKEFANPERFPDAEEVRVLESFETAMQDLSIPAGSFLLILTRGHSHDRTVLAQALQAEAGYIGMIGSRNKRNTIYSSLLADGFSQKDLDRVFCPVGLEIQAESPSEIGISIVAQLIRQRAAFK